MGERSQTNNSWVSRLRSELRLQSTVHNANSRTPAVKLSWGRYFFLCFPDFIFGAPLIVHLRFAKKLATTHAPGTVFLGLELASLFAPSRKVLGSVSVLIERRLGGRHF